MEKNKLDFKLVNLALLAVFIYFVYQTGSLWMGILGKVISVIAPFFFAFVLAYVFNPFLNWLIEHKVPKALGVMIIVVLILGVIGLMLGLGLPLIVTQLGSLFNGIITFIGELSSKYDINFGDLQVNLAKSFDAIMSDLTAHVSNGAISFIGVSLSYITNVMIAISAAIYLLVDMNEIRLNIKNYLKNKSNKLYLYVKRLDNEMRRYLTGLLKIMIISLVEYSLIYLIIGHPNALLLGILAGLAVLIPYFGGIFVNIIAAVTSFVISPGLFIKTIICFVVLSIVDGNVINPLVYGKTNRIHPLVIILSVYACGKILGLFGIIMSLPIAIIIVSTVSYFKNDIVDMIDDKKRKIRPSKS